MYLVLDKDTIKKEILPFLTTANRGFKTKSCLIEIVNCIFYKLKTGCQWHALPVRSLFSQTPLSYKSVFAHYRKWCKAGVWKKCWEHYLSKNKKNLDLSSMDLDGSHTVAMRGGEEVSYQGRKKRKTTNALYLTDRQGLIVGMSYPKKGEHHDVFQIRNEMENIFKDLQSANIPLDGLFLNADAGFDCLELRNVCLEYGIQPNICFNSRNGDRKEDDYFDEELYKYRYSIERSNAWMDSYRSVLIRFDIKLSSWIGWNYLAFFAIFYKNLNNKNKSR